MALEVTATFFDVGRARAAVAHPVPGRKRSAARVALDDGTEKAGSEVIDIVGADDVATEPTGATHGCSARL